MGLSKLNNLATSKLGFKINKDSYSICDLRPAYGMLFDNYVREYDFWGHCDFDVIWGDIRHFFTDEILNEHDIIWVQRQFLTGCFNLYKNTARVNALFTKIPIYKIAYTLPQSTVFDEKIMTAYLTITNNIRVFKKRRTYACLKELDEYPFGWYWKNGKLYNRKKKEFICMHLAKWKDTMHGIDFNMDHHPEFLSITRRGIWMSIPLKEKLFDRFVFVSIAKTKVKSWIKKYIL